MSDQHAPQATRPAPLEGIRVLDLTRILAGPWCTQNLADLGANVYKIEKPETGDDTRAWGPPFLQTPEQEDTAEAAYYLSANRNKQSISLDIASQEGADVVRAMARECDILVENFKVGGLAKYGLDYASLKEINPRLIYCSITGFGQTGPYAERPGYDFMIQAMGGMMSLTGERDDKPGGGPQKAGVAVADLMTGMYATSSILAALFERSRSGLGQHIDIALLDCQVAMLANQNMNYLVSGQAPKRAGNAHQNLVPYQVFPTEDGHIIVAIGNNRQFAAYCEAIGHPEIVEDERFRINSQRVKHRDALEQILSAAMQQHPSVYWLEQLDKIGVPAGPINDLHGVFSHPQVQARKMRIELDHSQAGKVSMTASPMRFSGSPVSYRMAPPQLGEHTEEALETLLGADSPALMQWRSQRQG